MTTIIVGDIDNEEALNGVREKFIFKETKKETPPQYPQEEPQTQLREIENTANNNTGFVIFGFHGPKAANLRDSIAIDVISLLLGETKSSRLYQNLIEKPETPVFNVVSTGQYQFRDGNTFFIQANFHPSQKGKAIELLRNEIRNVVDFPFSQEELSTAKKKLKAQFAE